MPKSKSITPKLKKDIARDKRRMASDNEYREANGYSPLSYTVSLTIGSDTYSASADDITEAILALKPEKINNRTVFTLVYDGKKSSLMRSVAQCKRIIAHRLTANITGRALLMLLR